MMVSNAATEWRAVVIVYPLPGGAGFLMKWPARIDRLPILQKRVALLAGPNG